MNYQFMVSCAKILIVTAILLFIWIVGMLLPILVPFVHSYLLILLGYSQRVLANMQLLECNPINPNELPIYSVLSREVDSNCNTTVHLDSWHPATQLGTLPILLSPHPTWLQPLRPCIYADSWVESTQMNYQFMVSWAEKVIVTAIHCSFG